MQLCSSVGRLKRRQNLADARAEAHAITVALAPPAQRQLVAVFDEAAASPSRSSGLLPFQVSSSRLPKESLPASVR